MYVYICKTVTVGYLRVKEALFQRHDARRASECCYNIPMPTRHLYSYRKPLWNIPLRLLYWLHGSSSVSVRIRELNVRAPLRRIYRWLSDDTARIFHSKFTKIWYCNMPCFYFLSLQPEYLFYSWRKIINFITVKQFLNLTNYIERKTY